MFDNILLDLAILAIFVAALYAFLILPQRREFKKRQQFASSVTPGTEVTTYGGIVGTVTAVDAEQGLITVEIADGIEVQVLSAAIMGEFDREAVAESAQKALNE